MVKLSGNIIGYIISAFHNLKSRKKCIKLFLVTSFWLLVAGKVLGQCNFTVNITFTEGEDDNSETIGICGAIGGGGQNDIDIYQISPNQSNPTYQWQWSYDPAFGTYTIDPYTGNQYVISSFSSTPGTYYFRLKVTTATCTTGVYSDVITLHVSGTSSSPPTTTGASRCGPGTLTLSASGCSNGRVLAWYTSQLGGTFLQNGSPYTTPVLSVTTTYWVSCATGTGINNCETPRTPVVASITSALPATPGPITGSTTVCANPATLIVFLP